MMNKDKLKILCGPSFIKNYDSGSAEYPFYLVKLAMYTEATL